MPELPPEVMHYAQEIAAQYSATSFLHPEDHILWFLLEHADFRHNPKDAVRHYFQNGSPRLSG
jgi:hypothetical protein